MRERRKANRKRQVCVSPSERNYSHSLLSLVRSHLENVRWQGEVSIIPATGFVDKSTEELSLCAWLKNIVTLSGWPVLQMKRGRVLPGPSDEGMTLQWVFSFNIGSGSQSLSFVVMMWFQESKLSERQRKFFVLEKAGAKLSFQYYLRNMSKIISVVGLPQLNQDVYLLFYPGYSSSFSCKYWDKSFLQ